MTAKEMARKKKTEGDAKMARKLAGTRSSARARDVSGVKSKKAAALAALKRERKIQQDLEESSSDGSEIGFDNDEDDSDEEYNEDVAKPWQQRTKASAASNAGLRDKDDMDDGSDMDIDEEDEERPTKKGSAPAAVIATPNAAELEDFVVVTIPRRRLARWCNEPFFDAAVLECFVRLFIGEDDKGEKVYRLCEIVDVKSDTKSYKFPVTEKNAKPVSTNKLLRLKFGNNERDFPMYLVSDTPPVELDIHKYLTTQKNNREETLTKRRAAKLRKTQDQLISTYTYTTADIERNLLQRKQQGKSMANLGSEQTKIAIAVQGAQDSLKEAEHRLVDAKKALMEFSGSHHEEQYLEKAVESCQNRVKDAKKEVEKMLKEEQATLDAVKTRTLKLTGRAKDQKWATVNQRALQMNQKVDRESYKAQQEADARKAAGVKEKFNPYARRQVKPKILWEVGQGKDEEEALLAEEKKDSLDDGVPVMVDLSLPTITNATTPALVTENVTALSDNHQFAIDEEGLVQTSKASSGGGGRGHMSWSGDLSGNPRQKRQRKGLHLDEYFDRKEKGTL